VGSELRETVRRAYAGSDFFRATLAAAGVGADGVDELARLPFTTKEQLRAAYPFGWTCVPDREVVRIHASSGTTGRRTLCTYTRHDLEEWTAMFARCLEYAGITDADRVQLMVGYGLWTAGWGFQAAVERVGAMAIPSGRSDRPAAGAHGRPRDHGAVRHLVVRARDGGTRGGRRWAAARPAGGDLRLGALERADPCPDRGPAGHHGLRHLRAHRAVGSRRGIECGEHAGMHVWTDYFLVEVVDPATLEPVPPGVEGELVVTTLRKEATPLLRYRTRDLTALDLSPCACGSPYPRIARLRGRSDDMIKARGVMFFPAHVEHVLGQVEGATGEYRIEIDRDGAGERVLVRAEAPDRPGLAGRIAELLRGEVGLRAEIDVVAPGTLPRSERKTQRVYDHRTY
jgi:phenylacetate-CoA ligase